MWKTFLDLCQWDFSLKLCLVGEQVAEKKMKGKKKEKWKEKNRKKSCFPCLGPKEMGKKLEWNHSLSEAQT